MTPYEIRPPLGENNARIVPYSPAAHHEPLMAMLRTIENHNTSLAGLIHTFGSDDSGEHLVAMDAIGVIGHVGLSAPDELLAESLAALAFPGPEDWGYLEVGDLFTDPQARGSGWGTYLLGSAIRSAQGSQCVAVLSIREEDSVVISFVEGFGMVYWGSYERDGALHYLYVDTSNIIANTAVTEA